MPRLVPGDLEQGMILSRPVTNANGVVMLGEATELTAELIQKIRGMDIEHVYVKGASQTGVSLEDALTELDRRFKGVEEAPYMNIIKRAIKEHLECLYG
jgi:hypothetical protein